MLTSHPGNMYWMIDQVYFRVLRFHQDGSDSSDSRCSFWKELLPQPFLRRPPHQRWSGLDPSPQDHPVSFSPKFKKIFESEDPKDGMTFVPIVDFLNLKKVVAFIYDGRITLNSKEELNDFLDALNYLKVMHSRNSVTIYLNALRNR